MLTSSPASNRRTAGAYSSIKVNGDATRAPAWPIHSWTPWPSPAISRPGNIRARVASSIAVRAALRRGVGMIPMPTVIRDVQASAAAAEAMALSLKQSSQTQNSSSPAASADWTIGFSRSGGWVGTKQTPSLVTPPIVAGPLTVPQGIEQGDDPLEPPRACQFDRLLSDTP